MGILFDVNFESELCGKILFLFDWIRRERNTNIHPDHRQDVEVLRERAQQTTQTDTTTESPPIRVGRPRHDTCPICLTDSSVLSVETNCGHLFCGLSIYDIFHQNRTDICLFST